MVKPILLVMGTRPEGIKLAPVYHALKEANLPVVLCSTFQHDQLLRQVLAIFDIKPDIALDVMKPNQDLFYLTPIILSRLKPVLEETKPSLVMVQGDTTTGMVASLAAFYSRIPVAHVEAGIRTFDLDGPFPEEANRQIISVLSTFNFAATKDNVRNLLHDGVSRSKIFYTGNTVTDALRIIKEKIEADQIKINKKLKEKISEFKNKNKKIILFTMHRRESFGAPMKTVFQSIKKYALEHKDIEIIFPVHPNPHVKKLVTEESLELIGNINLFEPLLYQDLIYLLLNADIVVTDSGGIQEEAASLGKFAIIVRERTDRPESVIAGLAEVVGYDKLALYLALDNYLYGRVRRNSSADIFGDGFASQKIINVLRQYGDFSRTSTLLRQTQDRSV